MQNLYNLNNPIPEALRDKKALEDGVFGKYNIVPYYGCEEYTSHSFLQVIANLTQLSPAHNSCKHDLNFYSFGENPIIAPKHEIGITPELTEEGYTKEDTLGQSVQRSFKKYLLGLGVSIRRLTQIVKQMEACLVDSGNAYLHIRIVRVLKKYRISFNVIHFTEAAYLNTKSLETNQIIQSEYWTDDWFRKKQPRIRTGSQLDLGGFEWKKNKDGSIIETVLHIKSDSGKSPFYGRPKILPSMYWLYVEHALANRFVKVAGTELVATKVIAVEEADPTRLKRAKLQRERNQKGYRKGITESSDFAKKMDGFRQITTMEGDTPSAIAGFKYPHGGNPPTVIDLTYNRDTAFDSFLYETSTGIVYSLNGWDRQLTNIVPIKTNIGGNVLIDLFTIKNLATIRPKQIFWEGVLSQVLEETIGQIDKGRETHTLQFPNQVDKLILKLTQLNQTRNALKKQDNDAGDGEGSNSDGGIGGGTTSKKSTNGKRKGTGKDGDGDGVSNE